MVMESLTTITPTGQRGPYWDSWYFSTFEWVIMRTCCCLILFVFWPAHAMSSTGSGDLILGPVWIILCTLSVIECQFKAMVFLTWHVSKTESKPNVEHDIKPNQRANAEPIPVAIYMLPKRFQNRNTDTLARFWRIWLQKLHPWRNTQFVRIWEMITRQGNIRLQTSNQQAWDNKKKSYTLIIYSKILPRFVKFRLYTSPSNKKKHAEVALTCGILKHWR